ncbi:hypothetical protein FKR81_25375 [Lentzea tibetensis]|uniref:Integral membrane protein n=1 Tax=Lentzea tibetensis TaxID=2591470 RepID=A0A563ENW1_9PSEU|nr:hypothetical protein [Lentzea tibetensis]TWP49013.1 hypothetical protein FKR81_25375 [Lentzea tibetensis]
MTGDERRSLEVPADEVAGTLAARRELGPDSEDAVIAAFLDRAGHAIDRRVEERLTVAPVERADDDRASRKDAMKVALGSIALGFPITGVATQFPEGGPWVAIAAWIGIASVNAAFNQRHRR